MNRHGAMGMLEAEGLLFRTFMPLDDAKKWATSLVMLGFATRADCNGGIWTLRWWRPSSTGDAPSRRTNRALRR